MLKNTDQNFTNKYIHKPWSEMMSYEIATTEPIQQHLIFI